MEGADGDSSDRSGEPRQPLKKRGEGQAPTDLPALEPLPPTLPSRPQAAKPPPPAHRQAPVESPQQPVARQSAAAPAPVDPPPVDSPAVDSLAAESPSADSRSWPPPSTEPSTSVPAETRQPLTRRSEEPTDGPVRFRTEPPAAPDRPKLHALVLAAGLLASVAVGFYFWSTFGRTDLKVDGFDIANAPQILDEAEALLARTAEAGGLVLADDQRCHFAPQGNSRPTVLCGPIWFGNSPEDAPWVEMQTSFTVVDELATGEIGTITGAKPADPRTFARPDGLRPAAVGTPVYPTSGLRFASGRRMVEPATILAAAEAAVLAEVPGAAQDTAGAAQDTADESIEPGLSFAADWRCYLLQGPDQIHGALITDDSVWCGQARSTGSGSDELWLRVDISYVDGPVFDSRQLGEARVPNLQLRSIAEGAFLTRPDGETPPDAATLDRPPVATDFVAAVDFREPIDSNATGLLVTVSDRLEFDALTRTKQIGVGARSFTAPADHDLVVASIAPREGSISIRGTLAIDGNERPLPRIPRMEEGGMFVVAVPEAATTVELIVENNGRPQTISLLDGSLAPGYPLALYRPTTEPAISFSVRLEMPVGESVLVQGNVVSADWWARDEDREWLPAGIADVLVEVDDWAVDRPCCEVKVESVETTFTLVTPDEDTEGDETSYADRREDPVARPTSTRPPRFRVPEDLDIATLRIDVVVTYVAGDQTSTTSETLELELDL